MVATGGTRKPGGGREGASIDRAVVVEAGGMRPASTALSLSVVLPTVSVVWTALMVATGGAGRPGGAEVDEAVVVEAGRMRLASSASTASMASSSASIIMSCSFSSNASSSYLARHKSSSRAYLLLRRDLRTRCLAHFAASMALGLNPS